MNNLFDSMSDEEVARRVLAALDDAGVEYSAGPGGLQFDGFQFMDEPIHATSARAYLSVSKSEAPRCTYKKTMSSYLAGASYQKADAENEPMSKLSYVAA